MSTTNPNPFLTPASLPQPNVMNQFNASGVNVMQNLTPGQRGIMGYRAQGGAPLGQSLGQTLGQPNLPSGGAMNNTLQSMGNALSSMAGPTGQPNARGMGVGRIRPPSVMMPVRAY